MAMRRGTFRRRLVICDRVYSAVRRCATDGCGRGVGIERRSQSFDVHGTGCGKAVIPSGTRMRDSS